MRRNLEPPPPLSRWQHCTFNKARDSRHRASLTRDTNQCVCDITTQSSFSRGKNLVISFACWAKGFSFCFSCDLEATHQCPKFYLFAETARTSPRTEKRSLAASCAGSGSGSARPGASCGQRRRGPGAASRPRRVHECFGSFFMNEFHSQNVLESDMFA